MTSCARDALNHALVTQRVRSVFQPIWNVDGQWLGFEALTRFWNGCPPDQVFSAATNAKELETLDAIAITQAIERARRLPGKLFVNISALSTAQIPLWTRYTENDRIVWEITETHPLTKDSMEAISWLKQHGHVLALDDAGTQFSTKQRLDILRPQIVKLSLTIVHEWAHGLPQALRQWITWAKMHSALIIAEGIEAREWIHTLEEEGVHAVQGFALGRPEEAAFWEAQDFTKLTLPRFS
ncbi:EAL domain-containing protein [Sulfobacillus thermosulfidooxidans]|uniref:EAL domain-containing protein n=1 Tax=Sulfobacillus thermosulfidooxidans TaxID=28034 RepID=UPI0006B504E7|nr:EAL domain-containing protein [Sulfobacillus thermosulfidooxidans]